MKLDVKKLRESKQTVIISSAEALKDINRINWSKEILSSENKVQIKSINN